WRGRSARTTSMFAWIGACSARHSAWSGGSRRPAGCSSARWAPASHASRSPRPRSTRRPASPPERGAGSLPAGRAGRAPTRPAGELLERTVGTGEPRITVAAPALHEAPRVSAVEGRVETPGGQAVRRLERARRSPPHVPDHAAEVEDDGARRRDQYLMRGLPPRP